MTWSQKKSAFFIYISTTSRSLLSFFFSYHSLLSTNGVVLSRHLQSTQLLSIRRPRELNREGEINNNDDPPGPPLPRPPPQRVLPHFHHCHHLGKSRQQRSYLQHRQPYCIHLAVLSLTSTTITTLTRQQRAYSNTSATITTRQHATTTSHEDEELQKKKTGHQTCIEYFFFLHLLPLINHFPHTVTTPTWHQMTMNGARDASRALSVCRSFFSFLFLYCTNIHAIVDYMYLCHGATIVLVAPKEDETGLRRISMCSPW
jgi:hypothetical protein